MCSGLHVKYPLFLSDFNEKLEFSRQVFEKYSNIKFHENPFSGSQTVLCGLPDTQKDRLNEAVSRFSKFCEHS